MRSPLATQELINALPINARVPSDVDEEIQRRIATFFQSERNVNERLPGFNRAAVEICERWLHAAEKDGRGVKGDPGMAVFFELSDYVLRADLDVLFGPSFAERNADSIVAAFRGWVENISRGANPATFFDEVGGLLREELAMRAAKSSDYELEHSVLQVCDAHSQTSWHSVRAFTVIVAHERLAATGCLPAAFPSHDTAPHVGSLAPLMHHGGLRANMLHVAHASVTSLARSPFTHPPSWQLCSCWFCQVYLEGDALKNHDEDGVVGLLSMTMMAAVFNTQARIANGCPGIRGCLGSNAWGP